MYIMLNRHLKSNIHKKENFYKEYSKNPLYKKLILKLRRLENKFYRDVNDFYYYKPTWKIIQPRLLINLKLFENNPIQYLQILKGDYETQLLKLQFRTLIDIHSKFGQDSYKSVIKDFEYIVKLNEEIFNIKLHKL